MVTAVGLQHKLGGVGRKGITASIKKMNPLMLLRGKFAACCENHTQQTTYSEGRMEGSSMLKQVAHIELLGLNG
jgi:hypothetical protein